MPRKSPGDVQDASPIRVFNTRALLSHNAHTKSRPGRQDDGCGFCRKGLDGVSKEPQREEPEPELDESDRDDEEGSTAPPLDDWWNRSEDR